MLPKYCLTDSPSGKSPVIVINSEAAADNGMIVATYAVRTLYNYTLCVIIRFQAKP